MSNRAAISWIVLLCTIELHFGVALPRADEGWLPAFRLHAVDPTATYSAGAAIDVNRDGRLDIVVGGFWYEAPRWHKHPVREVEFIRGRFDDYTCLPLDVNADGWTDFLLANYRSQKLGWVEHPGAGLGAWTEHVIERPGPMETGRLVDVDGDGRMDLLPNGTMVAAWWEILPPSRVGESPQFVRNDLPREIVGHGIGSGDINGDGRNDLVGPHGWLEAPLDRRRERWIWHPELRLGRDASVPILVTDVDADGDNDILWGRGHTIGLWWLEQTQTAQRRTWLPHAIDTSWSQPHTIELADLDGDGRPELVAGKRYLGHDGLDPGEWDPLVIYAYRFLSSTRTWQRAAISPEGAPAGFDVDPKIVDLDGDGDLDVVAPGRSGLYWLENLRIGTSSSASQDQKFAVPQQYTDPTRLLVVRSTDGNELPVTTPAEWGRRRAHIKSRVESVLGTLPDPSFRVPLDVQDRNELDAGSYVRRRITFAVEPGDRVPAWILIPKAVKQPSPAMLCLHAATPIGKDEPAGLAGSPNRHYAHELAERGYVCLVPDYPSFGEYPYDFKSPRHGRPSGLMKSVWNNIRAIDLLEAQPEVDRERIGVVGHALGAHAALFTALFDIRLRAVIASCGVTSLRAGEGGNLERWSSDHYLPRIRTAYDSDPSRLPFDFAELVAGIAPRPLFASSPLRDADQSVDGVRRVLTAAGTVYSLLAAGDRLRVEYPDGGQEFPDDVREMAYEWLERELGKR